MNMSGNGQRKKALLIEKYCKKTSEIHFVSAEGREFQIMDAFICPICLNIIKKEDSDIITIEDVPPKSVGGRPLLITCQPCNNVVGGSIESFLHNELQVFHLVRNPEDIPFKAEYTLNGVKIKGRVKIKSIEDHEILCTIDSNDINNCPIFTQELEHNWDGSNLEIKYDLTSVKRNDEYANLSILKSAYLLAFAKLGYMYILNDNLDPIRDQLQNPDMDVLKNSFLIAKGVEILQDLKDGVYYGYVENIYCVLVVMTFKLKKKNALKHRAVVALPTPEAKDYSLYSQLSKMPNNKTMSIIKEAEELPLEPIFAIVEWDQLKK